MLPASLNLCSVPLFEGLKTRQAQPSAGCPADASA